MQSCETRTGLLEARKLKLKEGYLPRALYLTRLRQPPSAGTTVTAHAAGRDLPLHSESSIASVHHLRTAH